MRLALPAADRRAVVSRSPWSHILFFVRVCCVCVVSSFFVFFSFQRTMRCLMYWPNLRERAPHSVRSPPQHGIPFTLHARLKWSNSRTERIGLVIGCGHNLRNYIIRVRRLELTLLLTFPRNQRLMQPIINTYWRRGRKTRHKDATTAADERSESPIRTQKKMICTTRVYVSSCVRRSHRSHHSSHFRSVQIRLVSRTQRHRHSSRVNWNDVSQSVSADRRRVACAPIK